MVKGQVRGRPTPPPSPPGSEAGPQQLRAASRRVHAGDAAAAGAAAEGATGGKEGDGAMTHLAFVIWMVGYPIACSVGHYLFAARHAVQGKQSSTEEHALSSIIETIIYIVIARLLWTAAETR